MKFEKTEAWGFEYATKIKDMNYYITKKGDVYNLKGHKLKTEISANGYARVSLSKHKKYLIHRLVAQTFIPNPKNLPHVNHINENKLDNRVENLEWVTCLENLNYSKVIEKASIAKQTKVRCIDTNEIFESIKDACKKYNLHHSNIVACCNHRRKTVCGYKWEYVK
jgi:hypothetical protein